MNTQYAQLDAEALLHVNGPDALTFLQGQTTCDTALVSSIASVLGAYCTPKGRVVCDFLLAQLAEEHVVLRMRGDIVANAAAVFGKYGVFSKVEISADNDNWQIVAVWGDDAAESLSSVFGQVPDSPLATISDDGYLLVQTDALGQHFECYLKRDSEFPAKLAAELPRALEEDWRALQIRAGIARIEAPTIELWVPQVLNYDLTGHISFTKGCYTGQEVVARLHYRGTSKRRAFLAELPAPATAGDSLFSGESSSSVGEVINTAQGEERVALISATLTGAAQGLHLQSADGPALILGELPYSLPTEE